jgi:hypothetical protein
MHDVYDDDVYDDDVYDDDVYDDVYDDDVYDDDVYDDDATRQRRYMPMALHAYSQDKTDDNVLHPLHP